MRALVLVALLGACKIADVHFIGLNGDDDANTGDGKLGDGQKMDGSGMANGHHAYLFDTDQVAGTTVVRLVMRDAAGALTLGGSLFNAPAIIGAVEDHTHTHLYALVANPPGIRTYTIATDGTLQLMGGDLALPTSCTTPVRIIMSPDGNVLAIGCRQPSIITATIAAGGVPQNAQFRQLQIGAQTAALAFTPNSQCLFVVDQTSNNGLHMFSQVAGTLSEVMGSPVSVGAQARAIAFDTTGSAVFTANQNTLRWTQVVNGLCNIVAGSGMQMPLSQSPDFLVVDPGNQYVLAIGTAVDAFQWNSNAINLTVGSPFVPQTPLVTGITFDPQLSTYYLTSPGIPGVISATVNAQGAVTANMTYRFAMATGSTWMELGP